MDALRKNWRWGIVAVLFTATVFVWFVVLSEDRHGVLSFTVMDVGQGDALFIDTPNGNQLLVDGGPPHSATKALARVMPFYDRSIDLVALSHPHLDHFGGLLDVLHSYSVGGVVTSGTHNDTADFRAWQAAQKDAGLTELVLHRGERINMGGGVLLDVLFPDRDVSKETPHNGMLVMRLTYGKTSFLLTGDMEQNMEQYLVTLDGAKLKSTVLKAGHHGSKTSSSPLLVSAVSPQFAAISVGAHNTYHHPSPETIATFNDFKIPFYRTDQNGDITFISDGEQVVVSTGR